MLSAQKGVRLQAVGERGALNLPQNSDLKAMIDETYKGKWRKIYRDAVRDNEQALACPTKTWKHALPIWDPAFEEKRAHVVFCVRNPYSWALSLARRSYHQRGPKTSGALDLLTRPWLTVARDNMDAILRSPMELWNGKVAAYGVFMQQAKVPTRLIRFEDFVADPEAEVRQVLRDFAIKFENVESVVSTKDTAITLEDIATYYRQESWKKSLSSEVVATVNRATDWEVAAQYGYYQLNPTEFPPLDTTWRNWFRSRSLTSRSGFQQRSGRRSILENNRSPRLSETGGKPSRSEL
ncbi:hypothetical protein A9Q96_01250 [Rhodobacterales bacterium 52_120_T64]|nr:hypothetical protein A9Q96_01250 [Rhodobacterales bacterium 52_120_T64]